MYFYQAYNLGIHTEVLLPELMEKEGITQDVCVSFGEVMKPPTEIDDVGYYHWTDGKDTYLSWKDLGTFRIREGREITIAAAPHVEDSRLRPPILGACMAVLLHQRSLLILHASAVVLPTGAVAFLGNKGWGKSTMAATLYERGHSFLTDDVLAVNVNDAVSPTVSPAFPQMKLWPSALKALGKEPQELPRLVPQINKRQRCIEDNYHQEPLPLKAIYLLNKGTSIAIEALRAKDILSALLEHSYGGRFGKKLLQLGESKHFCQCMTLAQKVPIYSLTRPSDLSLLSAIAQKIEEHRRNSAAL